MVDKMRRKKDREKKKKSEKVSLYFIQFWEMRKRRD